MFDTETECKEVMDTSNGDDHQLLGNGSRQIPRIEAANDYSSESVLFRRLMKKMELRKTSRSTSDRLDVESLAEFEYCPTPKLWCEIEERENGRDQYEPKAHDVKSSVSLQFGKNENERKWWSLKQYRIENGEQWNKFDQNITDTLRIGDAYVDDKKKALHAAADKEKS